MTDQKTEYEKLQEIGECAMSSIQEMVEAVRDAREKDDEEALDEAIDAIYEDPLSIEVRDGWRSIGSKDSVDKEFRILLSTGGPATQIIGDLDEHDEPCNVKLQAQDWFHPWTTYETEDGEDEILMEYVQSFCFYE